MAKKDLKEEQLLNHKRELELYKCLVHTDKENYQIEAEHLLMEDFDRDNRVYRTLKFTDAELEEIEKVVSSPFLREWLYLGK